jgi:hypothetical protein
MLSCFFGECIPRPSVSWHLSPIQRPADLHFSDFSIYTLTKSCLQCGLVITLSSTAFILGIVTIIMTWNCVLAPNTYGCQYLISLTDAENARSSSTVTRQMYTSSQNASSVAWHALQATSEVLISSISLLLRLGRSGTYCVPYSSSYPCTSEVTEWPPEQ